MSQPTDESQVRADDERTLHRMGYAQELLRRMSGFSNYAISLSTICILAGGITSFHQGLCSVGGASIGLGWPLGCLLSLAFAAAMAQVASAFPTAGGLYHWASILGGRGWGWATAWFNLAGLTTVVAAINVGTFQFVQAWLGPWLGFDLNTLDESQRTIIQIGAVAGMTASQAFINHRGIKLTARLIDFSGYWILLGAVALSAALWWFTPAYDLGRLISFENYSGLPQGKEVWPHTDNLLWLFALGTILPAYTVTGFDASAHVSEETVGASRNVPRGIIRSVVVSGVFGWVMLVAIVLAIPNMSDAVHEGDNAFCWTIGKVLPPGLALTLSLAIAIAQYLCGLAALTSTSRMAYAFARDGGLPFSGFLRRVSPRFQAPSRAIWTVATLSLAFTISTPVYATIATVCVIFLYLSYAMPSLLGLFAYGRSWKVMGPWTLGGWFRVPAAISVVGFGFLFAIGVQPPNEKALWIVVGTIATLAAWWFGWERKRFTGPPHAGSFNRKPEACASKVNR